MLLSKRLVDIFTTSKTLVAHSRDQLDKAVLYGVHRLLRRWKASNISLGTPMRYVIANIPGFWQGLTPIGKKTVSPKRLLGFFHRSKIVTPVLAHCCRLHFIRHRSTFTQFWGDFQLKLFSCPAFFVPKWVANDRSIAKSEDSRPVTWGVPHSGLIVLPPDVELDSLQERLEQFNRSGIELGKSSSIEKHPIRQSRDRKFRIVIMCFVIRDNCPFEIRSGISPKMNFSPTIHS